MRRIYDPRLYVMLLLITLCLCGHLHGEDQQESQEEYFDYQHFKGYPLNLFDTAMGMFDPSFTPDELLTLQELWKEAREQFVYHGEHYYECLETTKASYVLADTTFLKHHVVFLLDCYPGVVQWYEGKEPQQDRFCCMHTQYVNHDPCVIGFDGTYVGWPSDEAFNGMMRREQNTITTSEEVLRFVDFYLHLTSRVRLITADNLTPYRKLIHETYKDTSLQDYERMILKIHAPHVVRTDAERFTVTFFTFAWWSVQMPDGLTQWTLTIDRSGVVQNKVLDTLLKSHYSYYK